MKKKIVILALISVVGGSLIAQQEQALQNLILDIYGNNFDEQAFNRFVADNRQDFVQGGLGDLDVMISREADDANGWPAVAWASDLHEAVHHQRAGARAFKVLQSLNDFRTNKLSEQDFKLLESPNSRTEYCKGLVMNCLLSSARHAELEGLIQNEQDLKRRKIVPDYFFSVDALDQGLFVGYNTIVNRCPSLKIFPELNWVREKIAPLVDEITDANKASDDQEIDFVVDMIRNREWELIPSVVEGILVNSGLDVDVIASQGVSLDEIIDDTKNAANDNAQQNQDDADLQERAQRWIMIQQAARQNRSKNASWVLPSDQDAQERFIDKVFEYLETGDANTLKNLQNYMIGYEGDADDPSFYQIHYFDHNDDTLDYVVNRLIVRNSGELFDRADTVADLLGDKDDLQDNTPDEDYGKKVTGELLVSLIHEPRYKTLATRYYDKYKVDVSQVDYDRITKLDAYLKAHADDDGCKRVNAILNPQTSPDPDKGSWSTNQKLAAMVLLAGVGYILYSQYTSSQDDADMTAVA